MNPKDKSILIVDDDPRNIFALKATLASRGYNCTTASSAQEGVEKLYNNAGTMIVLLDMMMPEIDGYEALRMIRNNEKIKDIPVIAVTAQAMVGDRERCLEAGADEYVSKPIDVDVLLTILDKY